MEGVLVVAVCTKKDYMAVALPEHPLDDSCWVSADSGFCLTFSLIYPIQIKKVITFF